MKRKTTRKRAGGTDRRRSKFDNREHMQSRDYELYYYSDRNLGNIRAHKHNYFEFCFFLEGGVSMEVDGAVFPLRPGDVIIIRPGQLHRSIIHDQELAFRRFVCWISEAYCARLTGALEDFGYLFRYLEREEGTLVLHFDSAAFNSVQSGVFAALDEIYSHRFGRLAAIELQINSLLLMMSRQVYEMEHPAPGTEETGVYQSLIAYIDTHLSEDLSLDHLSECFYLSKYYLSHMFQEKMGISLHRYIVKKRIGVSRNAILRGSTAAEAFEAGGFREYTSFYRAFVKEFGVPPSKYKEYYCKLSRDDKQ